MDLKEFVTDIWEELDGATRYAGLAMSHRENSSKAQMLKEMASDEIHHAENFWKMFSEQIEECKKEHPEEVMYYDAIYKWEHEKVQAKIKHLRMALSNV
ncbi:MAG: hypothetical protein IJ973_02790 [Christensenellaceae bacterium]|nr:hypothetical protein [Christensenellaceae bacterium]